MYIHLAPFLIWWLCFFENQDIKNLLVFTPKKTLDPNWSMTFCRINFSNQRINSWSFHWDQLSQGSPRLFWLATIKNHSCREVTKQGIVFGVWSLAFLDIDLKKSGIVVVIYVYKPSQVSYKQTKQHTNQHPGVCKNTGTPKWMVKIMVPNPMNKWMILGYHYFWKHPGDYMGIPGLHTTINQPPYNHYQHTTMGTTRLSWSWRRPPICPTRNPHRPFEWLEVNSIRLAQGEKKTSQANLDRGLINVYYILLYYICIRGY